MKIRDVQRLCAAGRQYACRILYYQQPNRRRCKQRRSRKHPRFQRRRRRSPKGDWFAALFRMRPASGTPLQQALDRVGRYYSGLSATSLSGDPPQYSCQKNFAILATDGGWNGANTGRGNWDRTVPASMPTRPGVAYNPADTGLTEGMQFPKPYYEGATASSRRHVGGYRHVLLDKRLADKRSGGNNVLYKRQRPYPTGSI